MNRRIEIRLTLYISLVSRFHILMVIPAESSSFPSGLIHRLLTADLSAFHLLNTEHVCKLDNFIMLNKARGNPYWSNKQITEHTHQLTFPFCRSHSAMCVSSEPLYNKESSGCHWTLFTGPLCPPSWEVKTSFNILNFTHIYRNHSCLFLLLLGELLSPLGYY